jgi:hypothetical protein
VQAGAHEFTGCIHSMQEYGMIETVIVEEQIFLLNSALVKLEKK